MYRKKKYWISKKTQDVYVKTQGGQGIEIKLSEENEYAVN